MNHKAEAVSSSSLCFTHSIVDWLYYTEGRRTINLAYDGRSSSSNSTQSITNDVPNDFEQGVVPVRRCWGGGDCSPHVFASV